MLRTTDLDYELPAGRIATHPAEPRDSARLMVVPRKSDRAPEHAHVSDLPRFLRAGDLLVINRTSVLPARLLGVNEATGAKVQGLYLSGAPADAAGRRWHTLLKMRRFREGARIRLLNRHAGPSDVVLVLDHHAEEADAGWIVRVESPDPHGAPDHVILDRVGLAPLPPYILASRRREEEKGGSGEPSPDHDAEIEHDIETYQTVYADPSRAASVAAPTAGLHFTPRLLARLEATGVRTADVILHVGMGTFKPVETEFVEQHPMHAEWCTLPAATARALVETRARGGRIVAVGTTSARTLESFNDPASITADATLATRLLITPGCPFRTVDALLTNFHLPRSTLLAMVGALLGETDAVARLLQYYREAIERGYRFYSFGDAMLVLPD